jgi:MATE family multidrug resistance protein
MILVVMFIPIGLLLSYSGPLLVKLGQDPEVSAITGAYLIRILPGLLANNLFDADRLFLFAMGYNHAVTFVTVCAIPCQFGLTWLFVFTLDMGVYGCCYAMLGTYVIMVIALNVYMQNLGPRVSQAIAFPGFSVIFSGWVEYLSLGIPGAIMVFLEWIVFDILALWAGWLGTTELQAMALLVVIFPSLTTTAHGMSLVVSVLVGNSLGEGDSQLAKSFAKISLIFWLVFSLTFCFPIYFLRASLPLLFTSQPSVVSVAAATIPLATLNFFVDCL